MPVGVVGFFGFVIGRVWATVGFLSERKGRRGREPPGGISLPKIVQSPSCDEHLSKSARIRLRVPLTEAMSGTTSLPAIFATYIGAPWLE